MNETCSSPATCPTCKKKGEWLVGQYGPFCSRRCQLIDLGKWLGGEHVISEPLRAWQLEAAELNQNRQE